MNFLAQLRVPWDPSGMAHPSRLAGRRPARPAEPRITYAYDRHGDIVEVEPATTHRVEVQRLPSGQLMIGAFQRSTR